MPLLMDGALCRFSSKVWFSPDKAELALEAPAQYAETNTWYWTTGSLIFSCQDFIIYLLYLKKTISQKCEVAATLHRPLHGSNPSNNQDKHLSETVQAARHWSGEGQGSWFYWGEILCQTFTSPCKPWQLHFNIEWHCRNNGSKNNHLLWIDYIAGWCAASWVRLWIVQKQGRIILVSWLAKLAVWADLIWWNKCGQFSETFSGRNELWHKRVPWPRPRAGKKTVHHPYLPVCSSLLIPWQRNPYLLVFRAMQYSHLDSETDNGSSAKRHLGGGRDIHLKMLIPRCRRWHLKNIYFIRSCNVSGHIIRKGCKTINRGPILYTIH